MLVPTLTGCAAGAPSAPADQPPRALIVAEARSDVGNDRPQVSFDGLMVRRRIVLAIRIAPAQVAAVERHLDRVARRSHTSVSPISASVLDPVPLDQLAPDLVVALPRDATLEDGQQLMDLALHARHWNKTVQAYDVLSVLVHDLRFTVSTGHPAALSRAIAREGILSDALGHYTTLLGTKKLAILYTGPLLSDRLFRAVQAGIARRAHVGLIEVRIAPRTLAGVGVDLTQEPTPAPVEDSPSAGHHHDH